MNMKDVKAITIPECVSPYRQLEYIHFNGAESVHTAYNPYNGMRWELTFKMDSATEGYSGATGSAAAYHCTIGSSTNGYVGGWFLGAYREYSSYPSTNKNTVILDRYQGKVWINDTLVYTGTGPYGSTTSHGMDFGARIDNSGVLGFYMKGNIYNSKISNEGTLIAEYFPAQRKSDSVCGLYRASNNTFYPMTGTTITDAAAGPTVNENPDWDKPTVKKIEDSNGNIIWGSQSAFPYRRLEYVDMYGKYFNTGNRPAVGYYYLDVKFDLQNPINPNDSYGIPFGCAGSNSRRLFFAENSTQITHRVKNVADTTVATLSSLNANTKYQFRIRTYFTNNTAGRWWFALQNLDNDSQVYGLYYNNTTYSMNLSELPYIYINAHAYNSTGTSAAPTTIIHKGANNFKVYRYFVKEDTDASNIKWDYYPVQRKSDGAVGFYNVKTGAFSVIQNASDDSTVTTITEPIADEYWDLTAPS